MGSVAAVNVLVMSGQPVLTVQAANLNKTVNADLNKTVKQTR